jgi:hypothetical protein
MQQSNRFQWNSTDTQNFLKKALIQTVPVISIYIVFVIAQIRSLGFKWSDFGLTLEIQGVIVLYVLNRIYDAIQRFVASK